MFVEVGENRPFLEKFPFAFKLEEVGKVPFESTTAGNNGNSDKAAVTALTGVMNEHFGTIRDWIKWFLQNESEYWFAADEEDQNGVVVKVLQVLTVLFKFGYYDDSEDVNELLPAIQKLLDGKEDYPTKQIKQTIEGYSGLRRQLSRASGALRRRFTARQASRETPYFYKSQTSLDIDETPEDDFDAEQIEDTLKKFQDSERFEYNHEHKNYFEIKYWSIEVLNLLFNFQLYKSLHSFIYDFRWVSQPSAKEKSELNELEMVEIQQPNKFKSELSYLLTTNPRDPAFYKETPKLAKKVIRSAKQRLKYISEHTGDTDLSNDEELPHVLLDLACYKYNDLIQRSLLLLDRYYTSKTDIFQRALQSQLLMTPQSVELYDTVEELFLKLTRYLRSGSCPLEERKDDHDLSPVKMLTNYCWLENEVEGFEPHQINQSIILSFGVFPDVLNYVLQYCKGSLSVDSGQTDKLIECFAFLRALACKNLAIQTRLLQHLDAFIKGASGEFGVQIGELLQVVFSGGPSISLSVNEDQLWKIIKLMFKKGKDFQAQRNASLLAALNELLKVNDLNLPLSQNQVVVTRMLSQIREDERYWCKDLLAEGKAHVRRRVLKLKDDSDFRLSSLLMITDLLATCAYGDNAGIDAICCTIYTEEELIEIISSEDISIYRKRPFMKLLVWVYMDVHGDKAEERSHFYRANKSLWDHMSKMASVLSHMAAIMTELSHESYLAVKELMISPSWKYLHCHSEKKHLETLPQIIMTGDDYSAHLEIADMMLYYSEALMPFLRVFYSEFYQKDSYDQSELEGDSTDNIYASLLELHSPMNSSRVYFSQEIQVKLYYRVLYVLKPHASDELSSKLKSIAYEIESTDDIFHCEVITEARKKYTRVYESEVKLNAEFNQFVKNYKTAYEGRNTRKNQIIDGSISRKDRHPYSDFMDEEMTKPGLKYLPLGRSFQEHVALFNTKDESGVLGNPKEKLLKQLEISMSKMSSSSFTSDHFDSERQTELDIKCLQILRATIYNQIILIDEEDKERNPKEYRKQCEHHLHPIQNEIQDLGNTVSRVMPLLSHPDERVVYEVLAFLEAILQFGNTHVQEGLKDLIKSRQLQVFPTLQGILKRASVVYKESQLLIILLKARSNFDRKISTKALQNGTRGATKNDRKNTIVSDGALVLTDTRRRSTFASLFKRKKSTTKLVLYGGESRVPFMALYQHAETDTCIDGKSLSTLKFYDLSRITLISKVLGLMCDGQYKEMQNYLREQSEDIHSVNMVAEMATFLYEFSKKHVISIDILQLMNELLQSLKESCIGNYKNREVIFNANVVSVINYVLQIDITKIRGSRRFGHTENTTVVTDVDDLENIGSSQDISKQNINYSQLRKMALEMKVSAVQLLDALLEEISNKTSKLSHLIAEGLDINALHSSMSDFYILKGDQDLIQLQLDDNAYRALFDSYRIIMHLVDIGIAPLDKLRPTEKSTLKAWDFCAAKARSVEIAYKDNDLEEEVLTRVHFNVNINNDIREQLKNSVKFKVDRSTHADKLRDFHEWMVAVKKDTLHHESLDRNHLSPIKLFSRARYWLILLVVFILNCFLIVYYTPENETVCPIAFNVQNGTVGEGFSNEYVVGTFVLGGVFAFLTFWMLLEHFIVTWPHFVLPHFLYTLVNKMESYRLTKWFARLLKPLLPDFEWTYSSVNIFGFETIYLVLFLPVAASPLYCFGYLYCYCFFYIIINNDILQRALKSVTKNCEDLLYLCTAVMKANHFILGKTLLWVAILLLIIVYCYSVLSFATLKDEFDMDGDDKYCETVDECFITVLRFGLIDSFLELGTGSATRATQRFFWDITFFIIVNTIGFNIVFGIIVDTFSELRDERFAAELDLKSTCFICSLPSHEFDRRSNNGFQKHVKEDHNMWAYIFYSIYLDQIDVTNHNAIEKYVYRKIKEGSIDYIPFEKALSLQRHEADEELKEELEQLEQTVNERFDNINTQFDDLKNMLRGIKEKMNS